MTLEDLHAEFLRTYEAYLVHRTRYTTQPLTQDIKTTWLFYLDKRNLNWIPLTKNIIKEFVDAGEIYYHAAEHGIDSAMLLKLSRPS